MKRSLLFLLIASNSYCDIFSDIINSPFANCVKTITKSKKGICALYVVAAVATFDLLPIFEQEKTKTRFVQGIMNMTFAIHASSVLVQIAQDAKLGNDSNATKQVFSIVNLCEWMYFMNVFVTSN